MDKRKRLDFIERESSQKVIDVVIEKFEMIYWGKNGIIAKYNTKSGKLTFMNK